MSYSNGLLQSNNNNLTSVKGEKGERGVPGIGFKLLGSDYDMDNKKIFGLNTQDDVAVGVDYDSYVKDKKSAINKRYADEHFF